MNAKQVIEHLDLKPLPWEGGWYTETYRTPINVPTNILGERFGGDARQLGTAIYYLLTPDTISRMHRVTSDEIFHFYLGDPVEQLRLYPDGRCETVTLGHELLEGQHVQTIVPGDVWQGACLADGGSFALMGTTVTPGFSFDDFSLGDRNDLTSRYPSYVDLITRLT